MATILIFVLSGCMIKQDAETDSVQEIISEQDSEVVAESEEATQMNQNIDTEQMAGAFQDFMQESDSEEGDMPESDLYDAFLSEVSELIASNSDEMVDVPGLIGVYEATRDLSREEAFSVIGYHIQDVNSDGIDDLMIGYINDEVDSRFYGSLIFGLYTYMDDGPTCLLEGYARNRVSWIGDNRFFSEGSAGAIYHIFSVYELVEGETEFQCVDYYFTSEKDGNYEDIRVYYNNIGDWDVSVSEEQDCTLDEFWTYIDERNTEIEVLEFIPFTE